jgi:hypothetical protein
LNLSRVRVRAGYAAGALSLYLAEPTRDSLILGGVIAGVGELVRIWASGHIEKTLRLATGGPYAHSRNPLYVGSVLMALGFLAAARHPVSIAVGLAYLAVFYPFIIREEAKFLAGRFPDQYQTWAAAVPLFFPRITPGGPRESKFETRRLLANREWRSVFGLALLGAFMVWRMR